MALIARPVTETFAEASTHLLEAPMEKLLAGWEGLCASSAILRFIDINLRGTGQVMFQNNPLSGALFLAAVGWGSYAAGAPHVAIGGLVALVVATLTARWFHIDEKSYAAGLYGFNGILVGLALATFLAPGPLLWAYVVLGSAISVIVMIGTAKVVKWWGDPLTFPFVITTWLLLLASYGFAGLTGAALPAGNVVAAFEPVASDPLKLADFVQGVLHSISQVFLKGNGISALLFLAGLAVNSIAAAAFALSGAILAVIAAHLLGAESDLITGGLLGFSPVLTAIALGTFFYRPSLRVALFAALGTVFTVIVQAAMNVALTPFAIPALTAPFVVVTWMFLAPRDSFEPGAIADDNPAKPGAT
jgi:urea transporter